MTVKSISSMTITPSEEDKLIDLCFASNDGTLGLVTEGDTYEVKGHFIWPGSDKFGAPSNIKSTGTLSKAGEGYVKIYDVTNGQVIAEGITTTEAQHIFDLGALSNVSAGEAVWEVQMKSVATPKAPEFTVGSLVVV